ncbi:MAG: 4Fe-4S dicluster domain-containing protein [candidate division Zixibacteria bacterium]|jgi:ferredoxin|nr:4Fe-4S dicluster domain-containing protein [candidate division Zixibacteria bacterium]
MKTKPTVSILAAGEFPKLFDVLHELGYQIIGPTVRDNAVVYEPIDTADELPEGWTDEQSNGRYRLTHGKRKSYFGYVHGPFSWKTYLYPPSRPLYRAQREGNRFDIAAENGGAPKQAFLGVRSCELAAIRIQDRVLLKGPFVDTAYRERRQNALIIAVNCTRAGGTCFCASMKTGPRVSDGYDLALTEFAEGKQHYFVMESGSEQGSALLSRLPVSPASAEQIADVAKAVDKATRQMGRTLDVEGLKESLYKGFDSTQWEKVAGRCLTCGNCTLVCPTCFCVTVEEGTALTGEQAFRVRRWDSCFTADFSYIHGGSIRASDYSRYRQWLMHKLAYWQDQFGEIGCVGCGRCITWCPVGIDLTEEARAVQTQR